MEQITRSNIPNKETAPEKLALVSQLLPVLFFDLDYYVELLAERRKMYRPSFAELILTFPEARAIAKKITEQQVQELIEWRDAQIDDVNKNTKPKYQSGHFEVIAEAYNNCRKELDVKMIILSDRGNKGVLNIARAKLFPIPQLVQFNGMGNACCIFHSEKTPSMHYYKDKNHVQCFGCGKRGDSIDVYMEIKKGVTFTEAVKQLQ